MLQMQGRHGADAVKLLLMEWIRQFNKQGMQDG
jgi:hypothetical protein